MSLSLCVCLSYYISNFNHATATVTPIAADIPTQPSYN